LRASPPTAIMRPTMDAKKIPKSELLAALKRRVIKPVVVVIDDFDSVRVDPNAPGSPTRSWRQGTGAKQAGKQPS
jgi:hypothetical protein